jgi:acyl-CoA synthetase (AMP-forming)/AMP-acid ligase II
MNLIGHGGSASPALIDGQTGAILSFADLHERAREIAAHIGRSKALVFLACRNDRFTALAYAGALIGGHAVALLDGHGAEATTASLGLVYQPAWIAGPVGLADRLAGHDVPVESVVTIEDG